MLQVSPGICTQWRALTDVRASKLSFARITKHYSSCLSPCGSQSGHLSEWYATNRSGTHVHKHRPSYFLITTLRHSSPLQTALLCFVCLFCFFLVWICLFQPFHISMESFISIQYENLPTAHWGLAKHQVYTDVNPHYCTVIGKIRCTILKIHSAFPIITDIMQWMSSWACSQWRFRQLKQVWLVSWCSFTLRKKEKTVSSVCWDSVEENSLTISFDNVVSNFLIFTAFNKS